MNWTWTKLDGGARIGWTIRPAESSASLGSITSATVLDGWVCRAPGRVLKLVRPDSTMAPLETSFYLEGQGRVFDGLASFKARIAYRGHGRADVSRDFELGGIAADGRTAFGVRLEFGGDVQGGEITQWCRVAWRDSANGQRGIIEGIACTWSITGENPPRGDVKRRLGKLEHQVLGFQESAFTQFAADGTPKWGPPNGFGVMQLDNSPKPSSRQLWHWRDNVTDGLRRLVGPGGALEQAKGFPGRVRRGTGDPSVRDFTPEQLWLEAWQRYNGGWANNTNPRQGAYFRWNLQTVSWEPNPPNEHANRIRATYDAVRAGRPPAGWPRD